MRILKKVLILCTGNSCRSIIAEALINAKLEGICWFWWCENQVEEVNPNAKKNYWRKGIWKEEYHSKTLDTVIENDYDLIVTVCDHANETCPMFPKPIAKFMLIWRSRWKKVLKHLNKHRKRIEEILLPKIIEVIKVIYVQNIWDFFIDFFF